MRKKILPRILISIIALTIVSTMLVSTIFAKYIISNTKSTESARPASFNVKFDSPNMDTISANFAVDGGGSRIGMTVKRIPYKVTVTSTDSEAAANVTIKLSFNSEMTKLIDKARKSRYYYDIAPYPSGSSNTRISCDFEVYRIESNGTKTKLEGKETTANSARTWTSTTQNVLNVSTTNNYSIEFSIEFLVYHDDTMLWPYNCYDKAKFVSDAVTVDVIATQVDPMN